MWPVDLTRTSPFHAEPAQQACHGVHVAQIGNVAKHVLAVGQQGGRHDRKGGVLRSADRHGAGKSVSPNDLDRVHGALLPRARGLSNSGERQPKKEGDQTTERAPNGSTGGAPPEPSGLIETASGERDERDNPCRETDQEHAAPEWIGSHVDLQLAEVFGFLLGRSIRPGRCIDCRRFEPSDLRLCPLRRGTLRLVEDTSRREASEQGAPCEQSSRGVTRGF